jgi:DNA-binding HxlR family transcriptional regulator
MTYEGKLFAALADPTRRAIFECVAGRRQSVAELARAVPVSQPAISQHLKVLKQAGLVRDEAAGARRIYCIDPAGLAPLRQWVDRFWADQLDAFKSIVEADDRGENNREEPHAHDRTGSST